MDETWNGKAAASGCKSMHGDLAIAADGWYVQPGEASRARRSLLQLCTLDFEMHASLLCSVAQAALDLRGHIHGPSCGHTRVKHGEHYDYLVRGSALAAANLAL